MLLQFRILHVLAFGFCLGNFQSMAESKAPPNVLFIAVDDLRPELGCYGSIEAKTPHLDAFAKTALTFRRAYCQQATCSPSRTSLLTGLRPDSTGVYDLETHFRDRNPDTITLPQHFKNHGYTTIGMGKIYHNSLPDPASWSESAPPIKGQGYANPAMRAEQQRKREEGKAKGLTGTRLVSYSAVEPTERGEVADTAYFDGSMTRAATQSLVKLAEGNKPFFLAVGYLKPHLPFNAPAKYWDLYDPEKLSLPRLGTPPMGAPEIAATNWGELRAYSGVPSTGPLLETQARHLKHGYLACVSFIDAQIGLLLAELDRLDLTKDTIVVIWGDHGYQLGEFGFWSKHTNYEVATRAPLLLRVPGQLAPGAHTSALVEFVDIYPTLCDVAGLPFPSHLEGSSLRHLVDNPMGQGKTAAFSQFLRPGKKMGRAMRTDQWRYVEWRDAQGKLIAQELYDHSTDPEESQNLATIPEKAALLEEGMKQFATSWPKGQTTQLTPKHRKQESVKQ